MADEKRIFEDKKATINNKIDENTSSDTKLYGTDIVVPATFDYTKFPRVEIRPVVILPKVNINNNVEVEKNPESDTFEIKTPNKNGKVDDSTIQSSTYKNMSPNKFILPLTFSVTSGNTMSWSEESAGNTAGDILRVAGNEIVKNLGSFINGMVTGGSGETVEGRVMEVMGNTMNYKARIMLDDFKKQLYNGHDFREFTLKYTFVPSNKDDLDNIGAFITAMEWAVLPSKGGSMNAIDSGINALGSLFGAEVNAGFKKLTAGKNWFGSVMRGIDSLTSWIQYPCWFDINFYTPVFSDGGSATGSIAIMETATMACRTFSVQYGSDENGIRITQQGYPMEYNITMTFVETLRRFKGSNGGVSFS